MLFISTNHKMAQEYPQRVLVGNFIWNTQITQVVNIGLIQTKDVPVTLSMFIATSNEVPPVSIQ